MIVFGIWAISLAVSVAKYSMKLGPLTVFPFVSDNAENNNISIFSVLYIFFLPKIHKEYFVFRLCKIQKFSTAKPKSKRPLLKFYVFSFKIIFSFMN